MANLPFTREQLVALGFDPDKAVEAMSTSPAPQKPLVMHPEYQPLPVEAKKELAQPVKVKTLPKLSLQDKQADAMAALEVMGEQQKAQPEPLPQLPQMQQAPVPQQEDTISRYMNMLDQIKRDEKAALETGKKDLDSARNRDTLASTFANIAGIWGQAHGGKFSGKDLYNGNVAANAEKDYAELIRQYKDKKSDIGSDLGNLSSMQKVRSGESDFQSSEKLRDPSSEVSKLYRDAYKKSNPDIAISDNLSAEDISVLLKQKQKAGGEITPYQQQMLDLTRRKLDISDRRADQADATQSRLTDQFNFNKQQKDEVSEKIATGLSAAKTTVDNLEKIKRDPQLDVISGPLKGRVQELKRAIGASDPKAAGLQANIVNEISAYIKERSGTAVNEAEYNRLMAALPNIYDKPDSIREVISGIQARIARDAKSQLDYQRPIRDVSHYDELYKKDFQSFEDKASREQNDPRVQKFMEKNGISDRNQAIQILKRAGKL